MSPPEKVLLFYKCHLCDNAPTARTYLRKHLAKHGITFTSTFSTGFRRANNQDFEYVSEEGCGAIIHYACVACLAHYPKLNDLQEHYTSEHNQIGETSVTVFTDDTSQYDPAITETTSNSPRQSDYEAECTDDIIYEPGNGDGYGLKMTKDAIEEFKSKFSTMKATAKWQLRSGRYVEDILYHFALNLNTEHLAHSFTIDLDDPKVQNQFTSDELEEIRRANQKSDPALCPAIKELLNDFNNQKTTLELRKAISKLWDRRGESFNIEQDFGIDVIAYGAESLLKLWECPSKPLLRSQNEHWYDIHVWGPLIDKMFMDVDCLDVIRGESCSLGSTQRKREDSVNKGITGRRKIGRRGDMILRTSATGTRLEYGASEVGKAYEGEYAAKWAHECNLKLPKMLRDMLSGLAERAQWSADLMKDIQVVGYVHGGLSLKLLSLDNPNGYICRVTKGRLLEVSSDITSLTSTLELMAEVALMKQRVLSTMRILSTKRTLDLENIGLHVQKKTRTLINNQTTPTKPTAAEKRLPKPPARDLLSELHATLQ